MNIINPANETIITTLESDSPKIIRSVYETARKHQPDWAAVPLKERLDIISQFKE